MPVLCQSHFPILVKLLMALNRNILHRLIGAILSSAPSDHLWTLLGGIYASDDTVVGDALNLSTLQQEL